MRVQCTALNLQEGKIGHEKGAWFPLSVTEWPVVAPFYYVRTMPHVSKRRVGKCGKRRNHPKSMKP